MKRTAWITLRHQPPYRSESFSEGLENVGFVPRLQFPELGQVQKDDVVVTWNLNPRYRQAATFGKQVGAAVLVAENGYIPKKRDMEHWYALARDGHNGSGFWFVGKEKRFPALEQPILPWRPYPQGYILIADQRGIGSEIMACPRSFADSIGERITKVFKRAGQKAPPIRVRLHPGRHQPKRTLKEDLQEARAVVTWASNVVNISTLVGIPSFRIAPYHVNDAVIDDLEKLLDPPQLDREAAYEKLAWAQWSLSEIRSGMAFEHLLQDVL